MTGGGEAGRAPAFSRRGEGRIRSGAPCSCGGGGGRVADEVEERFGEPGRFRVDVYREYWAAAAKICSPPPQTWLTSQKERLKAHQLEEGLASRVPHREPEGVADGEAAVRCCHR